MPKDYNTYFEPFLGGGALLFDVQPKKAIVGDLNSELINTYNVIKKDYKRLREYLILMEYGHSEKFFKEISNIDRNEKNDDRKLNMSDSKVLRAARFIYLNKTCFNGLYRVNSKGLFNVPMDKSRVQVKTHEYPNIKLVADYLSKNDVKVKNGKFTWVEKFVGKNDFVYLDPPYDYEVGMKGFDSYQKETFGIDGQIKLAELCRHIDEVGGKFMLSNHNTKLIRDLYKEFNIDVIPVKRLVGGSGAIRGDVEEVIITNYAYKK